MRPEPARPVRRGAGETGQPRGWYCAPVDPYTHVTRARRAVFAILDLVSRRWIATLVSAEDTSTQVEIVFRRAGGGAPP
jgi:hypothetical protein